MWFKCTACWRVYTAEETTTGLFVGCDCGSIKFNAASQSAINRLRVKYRPQLTALEDWLARVLA